MLNENLQYPKHSNESIYNAKCKKDCIKLKDKVGMVVQKVYTHKSGRDHHNYTRYIPMLAFLVMVRVCLCLSARDTLVCSLLISEPCWLPDDDKEVKKGEQEFNFRIR